jgi:hypothetical protein
MAKDSDLDSPTWRTYRPRRPQGREVQLNVLLKLSPLHTGYSLGLALENRGPRISRDHRKRGRQPRFRERNADLRILGPVAELAGADEDSLGMENSEARRKC